MLIRFNLINATFIELQARYTARHTRSEPTWKISTRCALATAAFYVALWQSHAILFTRTCLVNIEVSAQKICLLCPCLLRLTLFSPLVFSLRLASKVT